MKMKYAFLVSALAAGTVLHAVEPWEDPSVNEINRLPARTVSIPCETEELAFDVLRMDRPKGDSRWVIPLAGTWDFKWKRTAAATEWEKTAQISVPGCWQLQGDFDPPLYTNMRYPIAMDAPRVTAPPADTNWTAYAYRNPVGLYTTTFCRPWRWWFRRTILRFDGVSSAFRVRLNGKDVGYAEDSRLPSEFDVTPYLKLFGCNKLEVEVYKHCDGTYLEDQDFWRLSGIFRDVCLISESKSAPYDIFVETRLSDDMKSASFTAFDEKGNALKVREVPEVKLWNPETPYLYMTPLENRWGWMPFDSNRRWWIFGGIDYRAVTFGFRRIEIRDSVLYMNGRRVVYLPLPFVRLLAPAIERLCVLRKQPLFLTPYSVYTLRSNAVFSHEKATRELGYHPRELAETLDEVLSGLVAQVSVRRVGEKRCPWIKKKARLPF